MKKLLQKSVFILLFLLPALCLAHFPNQSYIFLRVYETNGIEGRFEINIREINKVFNLDLRDNVTDEEIAPYADKIKAYVLQHAAFSSKYGKHNIALGKLDLFPLAQGAMVQVFFKLENMQQLPDLLNVKYDLVYEKDDTHRGFLVTEYSWAAGVINEEANISLSFSPDKTEDTLDLTDTSKWKGFVAMVKQGMWHIWIGIDHILFLLALILPSVLRRMRKPKEATVSSNSFTIQSSTWTPAKNFKDAFLYVIKIITFFTIAHTITLSLASLQIVSLPSRFVESIIALSIGLAAYHNIRPIFKGKDWIIAFIFGLFHGFGFASVLADLGLSSENLGISLFGFNVGVEIGQLLIIAMMFPILFLLRRRKIYKKILLYGSILLIIISLYWAIERIFDINLGVEQQLRKSIQDILVAIGLWS
ncbi:HupE/UreJ family protein [Winogradskyella sp. PG-2]|uniref:HupE/UreJ family protein n=1 Tax=Winogradskyella sp. PG-2 TaxID=754409 RepID=UPI0004588584|nr:HupE/UreJ family protein [Winogradskyella sp. PG-2]BAO74620.1 membrane protein [Winogradskyella sp. PG-2]